MSWSTALTRAEREAIALRIDEATRLRCARGDEPGNPYRLWLRLKPYGISRTTVLRWFPPRARESGRGRKARAGSSRRAATTPEVTTLFRVAEVLNVSVDYLLGRDVPMSIDGRELAGENISVQQLREALSRYLYKAAVGLPPTEPAVDRIRVGIVRRLLGGSLENELRPNADEVLRHVTALFQNAVQASEETIAGARSREALEQAQRVFGNLTVRDVRTLPDGESKARLERIARAAAAVVNPKGAVSDDGTGELKESTSISLSRTVREELAKIPPWFASTLPAEGASAAAASRKPRASRLGRAYTLRHDQQPPQTKRSEPDRS